MSHQPHALTSAAPSAVPAGHSREPHAPLQSRRSRGWTTDVWHLDRLTDWHRVLAGVRFSSDWNAPHAAGRLQPGTPDDAESVLRAWARPILILHGSREMTFPVSLARKLHSALPASTLAEIPAAAHMAHFDNSQAWLAGIRGFLHAMPIGQAI